MVKPLDFIVHNPFWMGSLAGLLGIVGFGLGVYIGNPYSQKQQEHQASRMPSIAAITADNTPQLMVNRITVSYNGSDFTIGGIQYHLGLTDCIQFPGFPTKHQVVDVTNLAAALSTAPLVDCTRTYVIPTTQ